KRLILFAQRFPIVAVHVWNVEEIPVSPPRLVEYLVPLFGGHAINSETGCGDGFAALVALRRRIVNPPAPAGSGNQQLRTIIRHRPASRVFNERRLFAIFDRVDSKRRRTVALSAVIERRADAVKQVTGLHCKALEVVRLDWNLGHARTESVEVDHQIRGGLWRRRIFLLGLLGFVAFFLGYRYLIAFGREGILHVLPKRDSEYARCPVGRVVELNGRNLRNELAITGVVEIVALRVPRRVIRVEGFVGDLMKLAVSRAPDVNRVEAGFVRHAEGQMISSRRPRVVAYLTALRVGDLGQLLVRKRENIDFAVLVAERDTLAVGSPLGRVSESLAAGGELFGGSRSVL